MNKTPPVSMSILVTGGCGFLGLHLVRTLTNLGHRVIVIDDLSTSAADAEQQLQELQVPLLKSDLAQVSLDELRGLKLATGHGHGFDAVAHLACPASPVDY